MTSLYKKIVVTDYGGPDVLDVQQDQLSEPRAGEARVKVRATAVSAADVLMREGLHPEAPRPPFTPGWSMVGEITMLGSAAKSQGFKVGQQVAALTITGAYSEYICVPVDELVAAPDGLDAAEAACLVLDYTGAYQMLHRVAKVRTGERVLIHGAAGGIGTALIQLGKLENLKMYGTEVQNKLAFVEEQGATAIDFLAQDFEDPLLAATGDGVDAVFDGVGGSNLRRSFQVLRPGGVLVGYGMTRDVGENTMRGQKLVKFIVGRSQIPDGKQVNAYNIASLKRSQPSWFREDLAKVLGLLAEGKIKPAVAYRFPLDQAWHAHDVLAKGGFTGKVVLEA